MPNPDDDAGTVDDPLEELLAGWIEGAMLAVRPPPDPDEVSGYVTELDARAAVHARARALAHAQCLRLYARLQGRLTQPPVSRTPRHVARPRSFVTTGRGAHFELSI